MVENLRRDQGLDGLTTTGSPRSQVGQPVLDRVKLYSAQDEIQHAETPSDLPDPRIEFLDRFVAEAREYLLLHPQRDTVQCIRIQLNLEANHEQTRISRFRAVSRT